MAQAKKPNDPKNMKFNQIGNIVVILLILVFVFSIIWSFTQTNEQPRTLSVTALYSELEENNISEMQSSPITGEANIGSFIIQGSFKDGSLFNVEIPNSSTLDEIRIRATLQGIPYSHLRASTYSFWNVLFVLLPIILIVVFITFFMRTSGGNNRAFDFGKSKAKINRGKTTTFKNVAGVDEEKEELAELIDFLKNPKKYVALGARIPKGVLLVGPPGTGKTLLARAVAGEANVPFYSISGSDFVEMFVGVGASRVRDMFKTAQANSPCIIFIDEIDAVGRQRGTGLGGGHDEREQTLNQLLVEMDGFGANSGVIVIAATNRADVLDPALLRPGRFDRQITVNRPDIKGRVEILKVHARNKRIHSSVTFDEIARRTPGFTGADLENLLNEAALLAARANKPEIKIYHIDEAVDRVMMGPAKKSRIMSKKEREFIAYHEAGHAVLGLKLDNANIVHKVTIIPRGRAGGYNLMLPQEEQTMLMTRKALRDQITGLLGGRVAEEITFDEVSTGAHNDFQRATQIARAMVTEYGMSSLGTVQYEQRSGNVFLGRDYNVDKSFSDTVALEIDTEVRKIIDEAYQIATRVIKENQELLNTIAKILLEVETLNKEDIDQILETGTIDWLERKREKDKEAQEKSKKESLDPSPSSA
jgi:cell division protease FtsH